MRDKYYKIKSFRLDEETFKDLKSLKGEQSWNLFFIKLVELSKLFKKYEQKKR